MAENQLDVETEDVKSGRWDRLKGKLKSVRHRSEEDVRDHEPDDLADFLPARRPSQDNKRPLGPKLDTSRATQGPQSSDVLIFGQGQISEDLEPFRYHKRLRALGLRVAFVDLMPETIGEGGDESLEPVIEVARRKAAAADSRRSPARRSPQPIPGKISQRVPNVPQTFGNSMAAYSHSERGPQHSTPPGGPNVSNARGSSPESHPTLPYPLAPTESSRAYQRPPTLSLSAVEDDQLVRRFPSPGLFKMRAEEGKAFLSAGAPGGFRRPGSSGSDSAASRSSTEDYSVPQTRVDSRSHPSSRDPPRVRGGSHFSNTLDPGICQTPQYPQALPSRPQPGQQAPSRGEDIDRHSGAQRPPGVLTQQLPPLASVPMPLRHDRSRSDSRSPSPRPHIATGQQHESKPLAQDVNQEIPPTMEVPSRDDKKCVLQRDLASFKITSLSAARTDPAHHLLSMLPKWRRLQVFDMKVPQKEAATRSDDVGKAVLLFDAHSSFQDVDLPAQLFKLNVDQHLHLHCLCAPSQLRKLRMRTGSESDKRMTEVLAEAAGTMKAGYTLQIYEFRSQSDLHAFQSAITGWDVLYDGHARLEINGSGLRVLESTDGLVNARVSCDVEEAPWTRSYYSCSGQGRC